MRGENETDDEARYKNSLYVPIERLNHESDLFSRLMATRARFQANFGVEAGQPFDALKAIRNEIISAAYALIRLNHDGRDPAFRNRCEASIGWGLLEDDRVTPRLDAAVVSMEAICRPILSEVVQTP